MLSNLRHKSHLTILSFLAVTYIALTMPATAMNFELKMPVIPEDMPRSERPDYVATRFWDSLDSTDMALTCDREFMEVNSVNFFYLLPHASSHGRDKALGHFIARISADTRALNLFQELAEQYLASPESPLYNEDCYIALMRQLVDNPTFKERAEFQIEMMSRNQPGTPAADFKYLTRSGTYTSLAATVDKPTLLLLYNPECDHCLDVIESMRSCDAVSAMIADGRLNVLAVCIEGDRSRWAEIDATLPAEWISGYDVTDIIGRDTYYIQTMPTLYLLDRDRTVLRKNITDISCEMLKGL